MFLTTVCLPACLPMIPMLLLCVRSTQPRNFRSLPYRNAHSPLGLDGNYGSQGLPWNPTARLSVTPVQVSLHPVGSRLQLWFPQCHLWNPTTRLSVTSIQESPQPIGSRLQLRFPRTTLEPNRVAFGHCSTGKPTLLWVQTAGMVPLDHRGTQSRGFRSLQYRKAHDPLGPDCRYGTLDHLCTT